MNQLENTLPNLFIPGAAKSGTSTLHEYLSSHPDICMPKNKEPNYFWRSDKTLDDYRVLFHACGDRKYRGDSSTSYLILPEVVAKIKSLVQDPRFIIICRNPIDRAWSHFWFVRGRFRKEKRDFREAFLDDVEVEPSVDLLAKVVSKNYYQMSLYYKWIKLYYDTFGPNKVLILEFERFISDPIDAMSQVFDFLEIQRIEGLIPIKENPTRILKNTWALDQHYKFTKFSGNILSVILPENMFSYIAAQNLKLRSAFTSIIPGKIPPKLDIDHRRWLGTFFHDDVRNLRKITGIHFASWEKDFSIDETL